MPKIKCPFCKTSFEFQGTGTCPSCGAKISVSVKTTSVSASLGDEDGELADLMKRCQALLDEAENLKPELGSGSSDSETSGADGEALLTKDVPDATEETSTETEASSKRGLFDKIKERLKGAVDIEEIIDDAKDAFGG
ncbi:MAG: hypothetical protein ABIM74_00330 [candidate division WOR-3 bacterium]